MQPRVRLLLTICLLQLAWRCEANLANRGGNAGVGAAEGRRVRAGGGRSLNASVAGLHYLTTGPCTANENEIWHYGTSMASSTTLLAVSGNNGEADVQCIVQACEYSSDLVFLWDAQMDTRLDRGRKTRRPAFDRAKGAARSAHGNTIHAPTTSTGRKTAPEAVGPTNRDGQRKLLIVPDAPQPDLSPDTAAQAGGTLMRGEPDLESAGVDRVGEPDVDGVARPMCERGGWSATKPGPVRLAMKDNLVVFGAAGCAELHYLDSNSDWQHVASLPRSLNVSATRSDGTREWLPLLRPDMFAQQVAVDESVLAVTSALDAPGAPNVVVMFVRLGGIWQQVDVIQCPGCICSGNTRAGCFGSAVAVTGSLLAAGHALNGSVLLYSRHIVGPPGQGLELRWELEKVLTSPANNWQRVQSSMFGAALAMSNSFLVVGFPSEVGEGGRQGGS